MMPAVMCGRRRPLIRAPIWPSSGLATAATTRPRSPTTTSPPTPACLPSISPPANGCGRSSSRPTSTTPAKTSNAGNGDDDFGSSAVLTRIGGHKAVLEGSKSGYVYALDEATGAQLWQDEPAQAGQLSPQLIGAIGGFIGSPALGQVNGQPALFLSSAVPLPFSGAGLDLSGGSAPTPDTSVGKDPTRLVSLHAVAVATGKVLWQDVISAPTYAAVTYSHGVVFLPATTGFAAAAYDANTGRPLWGFPAAAAAASGVSVVGASIFTGTGMSEGSVGPVGLPPELSGIWSFAAG